MSRHCFHRAVLLLAFAALAGFAGAAGQAGQASTQATASESAQASDNDALYDYRSLSEGGPYYAPGSYASWYYVAPPAVEVASTEPETLTPEYRAPSKDLHKYYDYDRYFGPLFG
jgi:hypothetical protein